MKKIQNAPNDNKIAIKICKDLNGVCCGSGIEEYYNNITYMLEVLNRHGVISKEEYDNIDNRINKAFGFNV